MTTTIQKWGNSIAVRLPKDISKKVGVKEGDIVNFDVIGNDILLKTVKVKKLSIKELCKKITTTNKHDCVDYGPVVGKEVW